MTTDVERMIDDVIKKYGFEAKQTLIFCRLCEKENLDKIIIKKKYNELMSCH